MSPGINILSQTAIKDYTLLSKCICITGAIAAIICLYLFLISEKRKLHAIAAIICLSIMAISVIPIKPFYEETGQYKYTCTLSNNVSANYMSETYEIIDIENDIWTIKDKTQ